MGGGVTFNFLFIFFTISEQSDVSLHSASEHAQFCLLVVLYIRYCTRPRAVSECSGDGPRTVLFIFWEVYSDIVQYLLRRFISLSLHKTLIKL